MEGWNLKLDLWLVAGALEFFWSGEKFSPWLLLTPVQARIMYESQSARFIGLTKIF